MDSLRCFTNESSLTDFDSSFVASGIAGSVVIVNVDDDGVVMHDRVVVASGDLDDNGVVINDGEIC